MKILWIFENPACGVANLPYNFVVLAKNKKRKEKPAGNLIFYLFYFICFLMLEFIKGLWVTCTHSQWKKNHTCSIVTLCQ